MTSRKVLEVIAIAKQYNCRPSDVIGDLDTYTAYCFDSACVYIYTHYTEKNDKGKPKNTLYFDEDLEKVLQNRESYQNTMFEMLKQYQ